jgi:uncharacterized protein (DUF58 family)
LDTRVRDRGDATELAARFERGVTRAASLVAHFIEEQSEVRLTLGREDGAHAAGRDHLYACLRRLALVTPGAQTDADDSAQLPAPAAPQSAADAHYVILLTTAAPGTIPAQVWRTSHVIYL